MTQIATFIVAGQSDIVQRLNSDGLASLGLAAPLLSTIWTAALPTATESALSFKPAALWFAPFPGMLEAHDDGKVPGLSGLDGVPLASGGQPAAALRIHPAARLRLERLFTLVLEGTSADRSLRPFPSTILIRNLTAPMAQLLSLPAGDGALREVQAGDIEKLPNGDVTFHDERGLLIDVFSFAAAVDLILSKQPAWFVTPPGNNLGTPLKIAQLVAPQNFFHVVDLHARPWADPGAGKGIGLFTGAAGSRVAGARVSAGTLQAWPAASVLAPEADPNGTQLPPLTETIRLGWSTQGTLTTGALSFPAPPAPGLVRDTVRVAALDLNFHLVGNLTNATRDGVGVVDPLSLAAPKPLVRDGSPVELLPDGRASMAWWVKALPLLNGQINAGLILAASVAMEADARWVLPTDPTPNGRWPLNPVAIKIADPVATVLTKLQPIRANAKAQWIGATNDVLITLPAGLPAGVFIRLYPIEVKLDNEIDDQPLLRRHDGGSTFLTGANDQIVLADPFRLASSPQAPNAQVRADALVTWQPTDPMQPPETHLLGNLDWPVVAPSAVAPALPPGNLLGANFYRSTASAPILGAPKRGDFSLTNLPNPIAQPAAFLQALVRQLSTEQNPREAPRLPTMARTESLLAVQLAGNPPNAFFGVLTGGWLTREIDTFAYRLGNPGGAGNSEIHAPGVAASGQLGFDLWVAALHRCRPVVPVQDIAGLPSLPNLPTNWVLLQSGATANPPAPLAQPSTLAGALLQTVPAFVETPELGLIPDNDVAAVDTFITSKLGNFLNTGNDPELHRQLVREVQACKYGRRDAQWALRRALKHARELIYIETPLLSQTAHNGPDPDGAPADLTSTVDLFADLKARLIAEPALRVILMLPFEIPFADKFDPWSYYFYTQRNTIIADLQQAAGKFEDRERVVVGHPCGAPGRPLILRTTTVIVDDVWCLVGTSNLSRRGLTFDGASDMVLVDRQLDRGAGVAIRAYRKALMGAHLGAAANATPLDPGFVELHQMAAVHRTFADTLASNGRGKLLPFDKGPNQSAPNATIAHPPKIADPDGRAGGNVAQALSGLLGGTPGV